MPSTATSILDGLSTSVAVKAPCRTVSTSNITLSGLQTISGYTTIENDRVLVKGQTNAVENGIYMASTGSWTRAKDADGSRDLVQGTRVLVRSTVVDGAEYELTTANPIVIGTTALTFVLRYGANGIYDQTQVEIDAGVTPVDRTFPPLDIRRYGGSDDGVTANDTALANVKLAYPGGRVRFPKTDGLAQTYYFSTSTVGQLSGIVIDADDSVLFSFPDEDAVSSQPQVIRPVACYARDMETYYTLVPLPVSTYTAKGENFKEVFLSVGDADPNTIEKVSLNASDIEELDITWETDTIAALSPTSATADQIVLPMTTVDSKFKVFTVPAKAGMDVSVQSSAWTGTSISMGMFLITANGYIGLTQNNTGAIGLTTKVQSVAVVNSTPHDFDGRSTHLSYCMQLSDLTIRLVSPTHAQFLYNGVLVAEVRDTVAPVTKVGFGSLLVSGAPGSMTWNHCTRSKYKPGAGKLIRTIVFGDSITDATQYQGTWTYHYRSALEGALGARVAPVTSHAEGGETSSQQATRFSAIASGTLDDFDYCLIMVGVNDIIQGVAASTLYTNLNTIIDGCQAVAVRCIVGMPTMFYDHSVYIDPVGQNPANYQFGSEHRAVVRRVCAEQGVKCVDTLGAQGLTVAQLVTDSTIAIDPGIRDNIHPSSYMFKNIGLAFARAVLGDLSPRQTRKQTGRNVEASWMLNGWDGSNVTPAYEVTDTGELRLGGCLTQGGGATTAAGTIILQLPLSLAPTRARVFHLPTLTTGLAYAQPAILTVTTTGAVQISVIDAANTEHIFLDGMQWQLT
jgi:lysophospholipase L1-like esterase